MNKIALVFPGQGSQYVGMGKKIYDEFSFVRETFEEANDVLKFDLKKLCFEGDMTELTKTQNTQPALLTMSVAYFKIYMEEIGIKPHNTAGHSLGEISALCCAGAVEFADALQIVRQRGIFMQEAVPYGVGRMAAVSGIELDIIEDVCAEISTLNNIVVVSNYNSPNQIVISGHSEAVDEACDKLSALGGKIHPLNVSAPFHSPLMRPAADKLREELTKYSFKDLKWPVMSNVTAKPYAGKHEIVDMLTKQIVQPVKWKSIIEFFTKQEIDTVVEIGPRTVLRNLMKSNAPSIRAFAYDDASDRAVLKKAADKDSERNDRIDNGLLFIKMCLAAAVTTKNQNWNEEEYQRDVVKPYRKIAAIKEEIEQSGRQPTLEELKEVYDALNGILQAKKLSKEEQNKRLSDILTRTGVNF